MISKSHHSILVGAVLLGGSLAMGCSDGETSTSSSSTTQSTSQSSSGVGGRDSGSGGAGQGGAGQGGAGQGGAGQGGAGQGGAGGGSMVCTPGAMQPCYKGPMGTQDVGACKAGTETCAADGSGFEACTGEIVPVTETCATPEDDDCDGKANEDGAGCICVPGAMSTCYTGPMNTSGVGICKMGMQTCNALGTGYDACMGEVLPAPETCNTAVDDDCDGATNEDGLGCVCVPNAMSACYTGPMGTQGVGICMPGMHTCNAMGTAFVDACMGEVLPGTETCNTAADDDCDGMVNESGVGCVCVPGSMMACYTGPAGTQGVGLCKGGMRTCNAMGTAYGACAGEVLPAAMEACGTAGDDNCNGQANEGCSACVPNANVIGDGGFELGFDGGTWIEDSVVFGTPLCDLGTCGAGGGTGPRSGDFWSWFGGTTNIEEASVTQTVTIPAGTATLRFYLEVPVLCDDPADYLEVTVDGTQVFLVDGSSALCGEIGYVQQTVNLNAFANGMAHTIAFHSETFSFNGDITSFFVDDITLAITCP